MQPFSIVFLASLIMSTGFIFCASLTVQKKFSIGQLSLIALFGAIVLTFSNTCFDPSYKAIISFVFYIFIYWLLFSNNLLKTMIFSFSWIALIVISDTIASFTVIHFTNQPILVTISRPIFFILYNFAVTTLIVSSFYTLSRCVYKKQRERIILGNINKNFLLILFLLSTALTLALNSYLTQKLSENNVVYATNFILIAFYIMLFFTYIYTNVMWGKKTEELEKVEDEYNNLKLYTEIVENLMDDLRVFKHDYNNTLSTINGYLENDEVDRVQELVSSLLKTRNHSLYTGITPISKIEDSGLKGLLTTKVYAMVERNIHVELDIVDEIREVPIDMLDLCRMLGVFLDNALEAALHSERKYIGISFIRYEKNLNVIVANSLASDPLPPIVKMSQKGFSTKGEGRGLGLYSVHTLLEKYPEAATLNTLVNKDLFIQDLSLDYL